MPQADPQPSSALPRVGFVVEHHYLKDLSVENPWGPLDAEGLRNVEITCEGGVQHLQAVHESCVEGYDTVEMHLIITCAREARIRLICEVTYVARVRLENIPDPVRAQILHVDVPKYMLPRITQVIDYGAKAAGYPGLDVGAIDLLSAYLQQRGAAQLRRRREQSH